MPMPSQSRRFLKVLKRMIRFTREVASFGVKVAKAAFGRPTNSVSKIAADAGLAATGIIVKGSRSW